MKKNISIILTICLLFTLLTGCQSNSSNSSQPEKKTPAVTSEESETPEKPKYDVKELTTWLPPFGTDPDGAMDKETWEEIIAPFTEETGVKVNVQIIPWGSYEEKYLTAISAGNAPDVGYMYMEMISDYINMGALEPFDSYLTDDQKENFLHLNKGIINGKQYALPVVAGNARIFVYNNDILADSGIDKVPTTWTEFVDAAQKVKTDTDGDGKDDRYAFLQGWGGASIGALNNNFYPFLWQAGGDIFNKDGTIAINSPEGLEATQFIYDLKHKYGITSDISTSLSTKDVTRYFGEGKVAFAIIDTKGTKQAENINWGYIPSLTGKTEATFGVADSLVMFNDTENKELTYKLVSQMLKPESMETFHELTPQPPISKNEKYMDNERFKELYSENVDIIRTLPVIQGSSKIYDYLYKSLQLMILGETTPEEVLEQVEEYAKSVTGK